MLEKCVGVAGERCLEMASEHVDKCPRRDPTQSKIGSQHMVRVEEREEGSIGTAKKRRSRAAHRPFDVAVQDVVLLVIDAKPTTPAKTHNATVSTSIAFCPLSFALASDIALKNAACAKIDRVDVTTRATSASPWRVRIRKTVPKFPALLA